MRYYEPIPHTADIGFKVRGKNLAELFANAAFGLTDSMVVIGEIKPDQTVTVQLQAENLEELLVKWLEEVLFLFETKNIAGLEFQIKFCDKNSLRADIKGVDWDEQKQPLKTQIKAVTFHGLEVVKTKEGYEAQIILDV